MNADFTSDPIIIIVVNVKKNRKGMQVSTRVCSRGVVETLFHDLEETFTKNVFY